MPKIAEVPIFKFERFTVTADRYQFILREERPTVNKKTGAVGIELYPNYFGTLEETCVEIIRRYGEKGTEELKNAVQAVTNAERRLKDFLRTETNLPLRISQIPEFAGRGRAVGKAAKAPEAIV